MKATIDKGAEAEKKKGENEEGFTGRIYNRRKAQSDVYIDT